MSDSVLAMRAVLKSAAAATNPLMADIELLGPLIDAGMIAAPPLTPLKVLRPDDLVVLEFSFVNLVHSGKKLRRHTAGQTALLLVEHQPQAFGEQAVPEIVGDSQQEEYADAEDLNPYKDRDLPKPVKEALPTQIKSRIAGTSRCVFEMPIEETSIDWTLDSLLAACRRWPLRLTSTATEDWTGWHLRPDLNIGAAAALLALSRKISGTKIASLDTLARTLAKEALEATLAGRTVSVQTLIPRIDSAIKVALKFTGRPIPAKEAAIDTVAAALYLRAKAGLAVAELVSRIPAYAVINLSLLPFEIFPLQPKPHRPGKLVTAIEMPYRLFASPLPGAGFTHADLPVSRGGRTELWHTRLGTRNGSGLTVRVDDQPGRMDAGGWKGEKLRFIWSPDYPDHTATDGFTKALDATDRRMLVKLTAGFDEKKAEGWTYIPRAAEVRRLMLTALGGDLEAQRQWPIRPKDVDLMGWTHRAAIGRDYFVRVEYAGFLFPFGHRATLVKITERKFQWRDEQKNDRLAVLRQRFFIVVRDQVIAYPQSAPNPFDGRALPFTEIRCSVSVTPDLATPGASQSDRLPENFYKNPDGSTNTPPNYRMAFWPSLGPTEVYCFPFVGVDGAGRCIAFETPTLFISEIVNKGAPMSVIVGHYNHPWNINRRRPSIRGQTVRLAPFREGAGDVDVPVNYMEFVAHAPTTGVSESQEATLQQLPRMLEADVELVAIQRITGTQRPVVISHDVQFLKNGFMPNTGDLFAKIKSPTPFAFDANTPSDSVGGIASPNLVPSGLSARHGIVSGNDLGSYSAGTFDPKDFFPDAKLLGFFSLNELLRAMPLSSGQGVPKICTEETAEGIESQFTLKQTIAAASKLPGLITGVGGDSVFTMDTQILVPRTGDDQRNSVEGELTNFTINLDGCLMIRFDRLRFWKVDGRKPDVDVDLNPQHGITFGGPLEFVNTLKDLIPANGFSDPPNLDITPTGITAGYSLGLPAVQVGVLSLTNISLGAAFSLPFTGGPPTARFNFAERHNTFNLTVSMYGGGGFVAIVVSTEGVREIEAALEFGANIAIDLGVASGSVYIKGGFYFHFATDRVVFEGYVELGGRLSILGLISASLTFHLSLAYESIDEGFKHDGSPKSVSRLFGQATLVVEIEILFFSTSVSVSVQKTFAGSEADPKFSDLIPTADMWAEYCKAFA